MRRTTRTTALVALLAASSAFAEVEFYQTVDRNKIGTEDTFRLTIVVGDAPDGATVQFPAPADFEVLSRSQSTQMSYNLGGGGTGTIKRVQKYTLVMRANRPGKLTIPPAALQTAQKLHKTDSIVMDVSKGRLVGEPPPQQPRPQSPFGNFFPDMGDDDPFGMMPEPEIPRSDSDIFMRATLDKDSAYVGEQVNLTVMIYSRIDLSSVDAVTMPKLDGFLNEDLDSPTQLAPEQRVIGGVPYRAYLLKRRALFAMKPGTLDITPMEADITVGNVFQGHRVHRKSDALKLKVKALPKQAAGMNVGKWRLSIEATQTTVAVGIPVQVRVSIEGRGNLKSTVLPKLTGPASMRIYEPTTTDKPVVARSNVGGRRTQEYVVLPQQTGTFTLPGLTLSYFNPETGQIEESKTDLLTLTVTPGANGVTTAVLPTPGGPTEETGPKNRLEAGGLKSLRHTASFAQVSGPMWRKAWFVPAAAGPVALSFSLLVFGLVRRAGAATDPESEKKRKARAARARLKEAEKLRISGKTADFYNEVEKALVTFLDARLSGSAAGLTRAQLDEQMAAAGVNEAVRAKVKSALDTCDMGRFAPGMGDATARARALDEAATAMEAWDTK